MQDQPPTVNVTDEAENKPLYYCAWIARKTNQRGHGTGKYTYNEAKRICDKLTKQDIDLQIDHYPLLVTDKEG